VVFLSLAPLVGFSVLMRTIVPVMLLGTLALLYCSSYYTLRGGACTYGDYCGIFYIGVNIVASAYVFGVGAALS